MSSRVSLCGVKALSELLLFPLQTFPIASEPRPFSGIPDHPLLCVYQNLLHQSFHGIIDGSLGQFAANAVHGVPRIVFSPFSFVIYSCGSKPWTEE